MTAFLTTVIAQAYSTTRSFFIVRRSSFVVSADTTGLLANIFTPCTIPSFLR